MAYCVHRRHGSAPDHSTRKRYNHFHNARAQQAGQRSRATRRHHWQKQTRRRERRQGGAGLPREWAPPKHMRTLLAVPVLTGVTAEKSKATFRATVCGEGTLLGLSSWCDTSRVAVCRTQPKTGARRVTNMKGAKLLSRCQKQHGNACTPASIMLVAAPVRWERLRAPPPHTCPKLRRTPRRHDAWGPPRGVCA